MNYQALWEYPDIHHSKSIRKPEKAGQLARLQEPLKIAQVLAYHTRRRVMREKQAQDGIRGSKIRKPFSSKPSGFKVSRAYMKMLGLGNSQKTFKSSKEFHDMAGIRPGAYLTSGGLWGGLYVRNLGRNSVVIDFRGSSIGRAVKWKKSWKEIHRLKQEALTKAYAQTRTKKGKLRKSARKLIYTATSKHWARKYEGPSTVQNRHKASSIWSVHRVNIITPTPEEIGTIGASLAEMSLRAIEELLPATTTSDRRPGDRKFMSLLVSELGHTSNNARVARDLA
jgi:hypothetical protein